MQKEFGKEHKPDTVNMLLNPKVFHGYHEGRISPYILTLVLLIVPILVPLNYHIAFTYRYGGKYLWIATPLYLLYAFRVIAKINLREKERIARFKSELVEKYKKPEQLTAIKRLHNDGAIEYYSGVVSYLVVCYNGNSSDPLSRSKELDKFLTTLSDFYVDARVFNITDTGSLNSRYSNIHLFPSKNIAKDMLDIVDYNKKYVEDSSLLVVTVYEVRGRNTQRVVMRGAIESSLRTLSTSSYRSVYLADYNMAEYFINREMFTAVSFKKLMHTRHATNEYYGSKVIGYDIEYSPENIKNTTDESEERRFIECLQK